MGLGGMDVCIGCEHKWAAGGSTTCRDLCDKYQAAKNRTKLTKDRILAILEVAIGKHDIPVGICPACGQQTEEGQALCAECRDDIKQLSIVDQREIYDRAVRMIIDRVTAGILEKYGRGKDGHTL